MRISVSVLDDGKLSKLYPRCAACKQEIRPEHYIEATGLGVKHVVCPGTGGAGTDEAWAKEVKFNNPTNYGPKEVGQHVPNKEAGAGEKGCPEEECPCLFHKPDDPACHIKGDTFTLRSDEPGSFVRECDVCSGVGKMSFTNVPVGRIRITYTCLACALTESNEVSALEAYLGLMSAIGEPAA